MIWGRKRRMFCQREGNLRLVCMIVLTRFLRMYIRWSLCTHARWKYVVESGLCCYVPCLLRPFTSLCWFYALSVQLYDLLGWKIRKICLPLSCGIIFYAWKDAWKDCRYALIGNRTLKKIAVFRLVKRCVSKLLIGNLQLNIARLHLYRNCRSQERKKQREKERKKEKNI